ncbi:MAG: helix-turn-helix domain-containing protein [Chloroflexota bacterium]
MTTVEDIWKRALPPETWLVAGHDSLGARVHGVSRLRGRRPGFAALRRGDLALLSLSGLRRIDERISLARAIDRLAEAGVVALGIQGSMDPPALTAAQGHQLATLQLPEDVELADIETDAVRVLLEDRAGVHDRAARITAQLHELLLHGHGAAEIARRLAGLVAKTVVLETEFEPPRVFSPQGVAPPDLAAEIEQAHDTVAQWAASQRYSPAEPPCELHDLPGISHARYVAPIVHAQRLSGLISIVGARSTLTDIHRIVASRAAAACALAVTHERAITDAEDRLQSDIIAELLGEEIVDLPAFERRANRLGFELHRPHLALVIKVAPISETTLRTALDRVCRAVDAAAPRSRVYTSHDLVIALVPSETSEAGARPRDTVARIAAELSAGTDPPTLSIGSATGSGGVHRVQDTCRDALDALDLGTRLLGPGRHTQHDELGAYRLLYRLDHGEEARRFTRAMLGALEDYDAEHNADLLATLEAYLDSGCSPSDTSSRLHLHRNTVMYRLQRIAQIGSVRLDDPESRFEAQLALRLRRILRVAGSRTDQPTPLPLVVGGRQLSAGGRGEIKRFAERRSAALPR